MPGKTVKDFSLPSTGGGTFRLSDQRGKKLVVYFYPKDDTPGCTVEGADFRDHHREFAKAGAEVVGISRDSVKSHQSFKAKMKFPFELLSDADENACAQFGVMKLKSMYGKRSAASSAAPSSSTATGCWRANGAR